MRFIVLMVLFFSCGASAGFLSSLKSGANSVKNAASGAASVAGKGYSKYDEANKESHGGLGNAVNAALNLKIKKEDGFFKNVGSVYTGISKAYKGGKWGRSGCCPCEG